MRSGEKYSNQGFTPQLLGLHVTPERSGFDLVLLALHVMPERSGFDLVGMSNEGCMYAFAI
jgi:hypothetical protein